MALPGLGAFMGGAARNVGGAAAGAAVVDLITGAFQKLTSSGLTNEQAIQVLNNPQVLRALSGAPSDNALGGSSNNALGGLGSWFGDISRTATGGAIESITAVPSSIDPGISSKYFIPAGLGMEYELKSSPEAFRRAALEKFLGLDLPDLPTQGKLLEEAQRRNIEMATSLTEREIAKLRASREYDVINQALQSEAQIRQQQVKSLGDVQRERVVSGYDYAKNLLESAINNVYERTKLENSPVLSEIAKVQ